MFRVCKFILKMKFKRISEFVSEETVNKLIETSIGFVFIFIFIHKNEIARISRKFFFNYDSVRNVTVNAESRNKFVDFVFICIFNANYLSNIPFLNLKSTTKIGIFKIN